MPASRKNSPATGRKSSKPLSKTMLLPHTASYVRERSLHWHLALAAFRTGKGNRTLLAELLKVLYLVWYLQQAGFGEAAYEDYLKAERVLDVAARISSQDIWLIDREDCVSIVRILDLHEQQLLSAPVHAVLEAATRVARFGMSDKRLPWQSGSRVQSEL